MSNSLQPHELQHAGLPVHHQLLKFTQTHVHRVSDAIQPSHPLSCPQSLPASDSILKSRDITLPTKVRLVKAMVFPVVMYGCETWTVKKAERQRIDAFEVWCWRRLLRVPWTARRSNQSILKEISPGCSLEGMMLKLKLPILWPPHAKSWLIGKDCDAGRDWGQEEKGTTEDEMAGWHHQLDGHEFEWTPGGLACCNSWGRKERIWLSNWTELNWIKLTLIDIY